MEIIKYLITTTFLLISSTLWSQFVEAKIIKVGPSEQFQSIKKALKQVSDGDQIIVSGGVYKEGNILIDKKIELIGQNSPVLDGENKYEIITIKADKVKVKGFIIKDTGNSSYKEMAGIRVVNSKGCQIENNILNNTYFGIYLANSTYCNLITNKISGLAKSESSYGNAIHLWKSENITIENNQTSGHRDGIYFEFVKNSKILNNKSFKNLRYGLHFMFSDGNSYIKNRFIGNGAGVAVMYTKNIKMIGNNFENNWGPASYGLLLKEISKSEIRNNTFKKNTVGIYMEGSNNLQIKQNNFMNNGWSLKLSSSCYDNRFNSNNFSGNSFDITTNTTNQSLTTNYFKNNYWDKYKGYDLNKDNIGDIPYRPVSLFSMIVEKIPYSIIFLRSLSVDILDTTEKVIPAFIPKSIVDEQPLMRIRKY